MRSLWRVVAVLVLLGTTIGCASTEESATPEAESYTLQVAGAVQEERAFSGDELLALGTQDSTYTDSDGVSTTYNGVPFAALFTDVGLADDAATLVFSAGDGYEAQVPLADVLACTDAIVAYQPDSGFRVVLPGFVGKVQVRGLVKIQVLSTAESMPEAPASVAGDIPNDGPVTITDAAGRAVEFEQLPRRIVVVGHGPYMGVHLLYTFPEARTRLIGVESKSDSQSDFLNAVDPTFAERVVSLATNPNAEQIAALEPDLVLMKSVVEQELGDALAQIGIPVVYLGLETPEQFFQDVTNLGLLLGNTSRAEEIVAFYRSRLDRITTRVADIPEDERPGVLLVEYTDRGSEVAVEVPAMAWMQTYQVQTAGGTPVWGNEAQITDGWTVVNVEQIAAWDPDKIFVVMSYDKDSQAIIDGLKAAPYWSELEAVKNGELYAFPMDHFQWDTPEPRWILGFTWLAARIHPDLFADVDMQEEVYAFFGDLYGMDRTAVDTTIMPKVFLNVH